LAAQRAGRTEQSLADHSAHCSAGRSEQLTVGSSVGPKADARAARWGHCWAGCSEHTKAVCLAAKWGVQRAEMRADSTAARSERSLVDRWAEH